MKGAAGEFIALNPPAFTAVKPEGRGGGGASAAGVGFLSCPAIAPFVHDEIRQVRSFLPFLATLGIPQWLIGWNRELEQDLVPEWRAKYLDYKVRLDVLIIMHHLRSGC